MKKTKRILSVLLAVVMILSMLPLSISSAVVIANGTTGNCQWSLDDSGVFTVSGNGTMGFYSEWQYSPYLNRYRDKIITAKIEEGVTEVGSNAFCCCEKLNSVEICDSATAIQFYAFNNCFSLSTVKLPENLTYIGTSAFYQCYALETVHMGRNIKTIESYAFGRCNSLKEIYYSGTEEEWNSINIRSGNDYLKNANIHFNSGTQKNEAFGWPVINIPQSFGDTADYDFSEYFSVNGADFRSVINSLFSKKWNGYCFGMSLLALADYNSQIDLMPYFDNEGETLNEFGYETIKELSLGSEYDGNAYVLTGNEEILKMIRRAHLSQYSVEFESTEVFGLGGTLEDFIEYCKDGTKPPLLIELYYSAGGGHTVAVDPTKEVEMTTEGTCYVVYLYDPNAPRVTKKLDGQSKVYDTAQSYLLVDIENNKWAYCVDNTWKQEWRSRYEFFESSPSYKTIKFFDVSKLGPMFFSSKMHLKDNAVIIHTSDLVSFEVNSFDEKIFALSNDGYRLYDDIVDYSPFLQGNDESDSKLGCLTLPAGKYTFTTDGEASFIRFIEDDYMVFFSADDGLVVNFDDENKNITIKNVGDKEVSFEFGVENIQNNSADVVKGKIEPEKEICIDFSGGESDSASVITTTGKLDSITTSYIKNNEKTDSHYHKCAYADSGHLQSDWITQATASCTQAGSKYTECTVCYERLSTEEIPATGHIDTNKDNLCDNCGEKIKQDVDTNCNHICHTDNKFLKFIWTIFNFLMKLFSMERICTCGATHY